MNLPYLNTTQISVKLEGKCLKVSFGKLFRTVNYLVRLEFSLAEKLTNGQVDFLRPVSCYVMNSFLLETYLHTHV